jgi:hypothetical protein
MNIEQTIRKLARSTYYQNIYSSAKELGSIQLFENKVNLSGLQSVFLFWLGIYESLYKDLAHKEWKYLDEKVIKDDIRCDAFLYWRSQMREDAILKQKQQEKVSKLNFKGNGSVSTFDVDFK